MKNIETRKERFIRIAEARTNKIISMVQLLGNCSNKSAYEYSDKEINEIFNAIDKELRIAKNRFSNSEEKQSKFRLFR